MKKLWLVEIWEEEREVFKSIIGHLAIYLLLIGALVISNYIISMSNLPEDKKAIFEKIDFWSIIIIFTIMITYSISKVALISIKKIMYDK